MAKQLTRFRKTDGKLADLFNVSTYEIGFYEDDYGNPWYCTGDSYLSMDTHREEALQHFKESGELLRQVWEKIESGKGSEIQSCVLEDAFDIPSFGVGTVWRVASGAEAVRIENELIKVKSIKRKSDLKMGMGYAVGVIGSHCTYVGRDVWLVNDSVTDDYMGSLMQ